MRQAYDYWQDQPDSTIYGNGRLANGRRGHPPEVGCGYGGSLLHEHAPARRLLDLVTDASESYLSIAYTIGRADGLCGHRHPAPREGGETPGPDSAQHSSRSYLFSTCRLPGPSRGREPPRDHRSNMNAADPYRAGRPTAFHYTPRADAQHATTRDTERDHRIPAHHLKRRLLLPGGLKTTQNHARPVEPENAIHEGCREEAQEPNGMLPERRYQTPTRAEEQTTRHEYVSARLTYRDTHPPCILSDPRKRRRNRMGCCQRLDIKRRRELKNRPHATNTFRLGSPIGTHTHPSCIVSRGGSISMVFYYIIQLNRKKIASEMKLSVIIVPNI